MDRSSGSSGIRERLARRSAQREGGRCCRLLAALAALFAFKAAAKMPDFEVYWRAGVRALAAEPLYREEDAHFQLKYLPAFAVLAIPAGLLPLTGRQGGVVQRRRSGLIPVLIALSLGLLPAHANQAAVAPRRADVRAMAKFYGHELVLGQVNLLFAVVIVAAVHRADRRTQGGVGGLLFALAVVIKPYAVLFVPWLAGAARSCARSAVGGRRHRRGAASCRFRSTASSGTDRAAPRLVADRDRIDGAEPAQRRQRVARGDVREVDRQRDGRRRSLATLCALLLLADAAAMFCGGDASVAPDGLEAALLLTLIPLLSPQGWDYVFLIATPAVVYLVNYDRELPAGAPRPHLGGARADRVQPLRRHRPDDLRALHGAVDHQRVLPRRGVGADRPEAAAGRVTAGLRRHSRRC